MELKRNGTQPSARGPSECFTGTVRIDRLFSAPEPAREWRLRDFEPCARSNWHTHPLGQTYSDVRYSTRSLFSCALKCSANSAS